MTAPLPAISVIIPTRSAPAVLEQTLACLARQTLPADCYEVIVVGGVAEDAVRMRVPAQLPYVLRIHQEPGPGAARRRNAGARMARGDLLVFLDDDMAADAGLLEAHQMAHAAVEEQAAAENQVVIGYLPPWFAGGPARPERMLTMNLRDWWEDTFRAMARRGHRFVYSELFSGNFSLPAALFRRVGGFDPEFVCHEDYELGFRLLAAGAQFGVCLDARSLHNDTTDLRRLVRRKEAEGKADVQLARRHPVLAPSLPFARQVDGLPLPNRLLRGLTRHWPWVGQAVTTLLLPLAALLERLKMRASWQRLLGGLLVHSYWMGVFTETRHWPAIRALTSGPRTCTAQLQVDLANGLEAAERALDATRPNGVQITWRGLLLGQIPCQIGAEGLRPAHLRDWSEAGGAAALHRARTLFAALGLEGEREDIRWPMEAYQPAQPEHPASHLHLEPALVSELELSGGLPALREQAGKGERRRVLCRRSGRPVGWLDLRAQPDARSEPELIQALFNTLDPAILMDAPAARAAPAAEQNGLPEISVVVCTRDRPERLDGCLRALRAQTRPALEIIVVDNASSDERTAQTAGQWGARCVREPRPGLDFARNRGLEEAIAPLVAYVDDDARPARDWLEVLAKTFACGNGAGTGTDAAVSAVTGMVGPVELETVAQNLFERQYGGMGHGFVRRLVRRNLLNTYGLLYASGFGVGTNMAFRRDVLRELGGFDPALDVGGPAGGGGDVEMLHRLVAAGHCLVYEPSALVWHQHRRDMNGLHRQIFDNGRSFGAYLLTCARRGSLPWHTIAGFALLDWGIGWHVYRLLRPGGLPRSLVLAELAGALFSPWAYLRAVWRIKKLEKTK